MKGEIEAWMKDENGDESVLNKKECKNYTHIQYHHLLFCTLSSNCLIGESGTESPVDIALFVLKIKGKYRIKSYR